VMSSGTPARGPRPSSVHRQATSHRAVGGTRPWVPQASRGGACTPLHASLHASLWPGPGASCAPTGAVPTRVPVLGGDGVPGPAAIPAWAQGRPHRGPPVLLSGTAIGTTGSPGARAAAAALGAPVPHCPAPWSAHAAPAGARAPTGLTRATATATAAATATATATAIVAAAAAAAAAVDGLLCSHLGTIVRLPSERP
jgi:hypothetical protein